jgi:hypothetical protein
VSRAWLSACLILQLAILLALLAAGCNFQVPIPKL